MNAIIPKKPKIKDPRKTIERPIEAVSVATNENTHIEWEVPYIDSKLVIQTSMGLFHYEMIIAGLSYTSDKGVTYRASCRAKIFPVCLYHKKKNLSFKVCYKESICKEYPQICISVKDCKAVIGILNKEELNPDEVSKRFKVYMEDFIENEYGHIVLKQIDSYFDKISLS